LAKSTWSLEKELREVAGAGSFDEALRALGMVAENEGEALVVEETAWTRAGSETYVFRFSVQPPRKAPRAFLLKACVAFSPGSSPDEILDSWIERRAILSRLGVGTPRLHGRGKGIIVEEYVKYSLREVLARDPKKSTLIDMAHLAGALVVSGFASVQPFRDLRSRGDDVVMIDFGADIGPPGAISADLADRVFEDLMATLAEWGCTPLPPLTRAAMHSHYRRLIDTEDVTTKGRYS